MYTIVEYIVNKDGELHPRSVKEEQKYTRLMHSLKPGMKVQVMYEIIFGDHSLVQLAKVHALIRELAHCTGNDFEDVKLEVKRKAALTLRSKDADGNPIEIVKSFSDCSKDQLSAAIEACIEIGNEVGCILY